MQTLGEFYKEKILPRNDLEEVYLPCPRIKLKIDHRLFEWRIYYTPKKYIVCKSEYEARYFKVWMAADVTTISIPRDEEFLKTIVPELENLKNELDKAMEEGLDSFVLSRKNREAVARVAWRELTRYQTEEEYEAEYQEALQSQDSQPQDEGDESTKKPKKRRRDRCQD